jgi:hypothetical protein
MMEDDDDAPIGNVQYDAFFDFAMGDLEVDEEL